MKKIQEEKEYRINKIRSICLKTLFVVVFISFCIQVIISNMVSASGDKIQLLEQRLQTLQTQNENINTRIVQLTSLSYLQHQAEKEGYIQSNSVVYLTPIINVAKSY